MENSVTLKLNTKFLKAFQNRYPLIQREYFTNWPDEITEGTLLRLHGPNHQFIGNAYYGKQNKGDGWIYSFTDDKKTISQHFHSALQEAISKRERFFHDITTTAFRLFNGEGDHFGGITIDYYDGFLLLQWYSEGVYSFKADLLPILFDLPFTRGIYEKRRFEQADTPKDDFIGGSRATFPLIIKENGIHYATYLDDGWMTGIFLDQKEVRKKLSLGYTAGKTVLNTFSYTGAFSVAALFGGALQTTSVDVAKRSLSKTKEQFAENGLNSDSQQIIVEDVFHYFKYAVRKNLHFDIVIVDPPSFARTKKTTFQVAKDYPALLEQVIQITATNGTIIASTNYAGFQLKKFKQLIQTAFKASKRTYKIEQIFTLPADFTINPAFPEGDYLKVVFLKLDV
ncbi:class I SAM-dependent rRNA methyltransferase [Listeria sp. PSOL-1]|uniref:class I SAM-dependent rRNA methyltransferase n=1 Tax=Listeria sp. PSOL-1 TaxID=1844999 RepID=UPI0013D2FC55|nr:class I SAM-dependent rRNA methyltransferase [Listeria sp. PSOL-1]